MFIWWHNRGTSLSSIDDKFTEFADVTSEWAGRWPTTAISLVLFFLWIATGPMMHWSDTWQLIANTPTTWIELFLGFFTLAAANRIDRRNWTLHLNMLKTMQHVERLELKIAKVLNISDE